MKKLQLPVILILITLISSFWLPWYIIPMMCFVLGYMYSLKTLVAFLIGLLTTGLTWIVLAFLYDSSASVSIAQLLSKLLGDIPVYMIYILTGLSIGLVSGLAMMSGRLFNLGRNNNRQY